MVRLTNTELAHMRSRMNDVYKEAKARIIKKHTKVLKEPSCLGKVRWIWDGCADLKRPKPRSEKEAKAWLSKTVESSYSFEGLDLEEVHDDKASETEVRKLAEVYSKALDVVILRQREEGLVAFDLFMKEMAKV